MVSVLWCKGGICFYIVIPDEIQDAQFQKIKSHWAFPTISDSFQDRSLNTPYIYTKSGWRGETKES